MEFREMISAGHSRRGAMFLSAPSQPRLGDLASLGSRVSSLSFSSPNLQYMVHEAADHECGVGLVLELLLFGLVVHVERAAVPGGLADRVGSAVCVNEKGLAVPHGHRLAVVATEKMAAVLLKSRTFSTLRKCLVAVFSGPSRTVMLTSLIAASRVPSITGATRSGAATLAERTSATTWPFASDSVPESLTCMSLLRLTTTALRPTLPSHEMSSRKNVTSTDFFHIETEARSSAADLAAARAPFAEIPPSSLTSMRCSSLACAGVSIEGSSITSV